MINILTSILFVLVFLYAGLNISIYFWKEESALAKFVLGVSVALCFMMWFPAVIAFFISFNMAAQIIALVIAAIIGGSFTVKNSPALKAFCLELYANKRDFLYPMPFFAIAAILPFSHVLSVSEMGGYNSGQSTFGDMALHLSFITSLSEQQTFPPFYNLLGLPVQIGYPFLCDSISSTLYIFSKNLRFSYILPMELALFAVVYGAWIFFESWLKEKGKTFLASTLFFIGGGFGFVYFLDLIKLDPDKINSIFTGYYTTPMNLIDKNIRWVNVIADMLIPQRATLFGWSILFPILFLLYKAAFSLDAKKSKYFYSMGLLAGSLPLIHTHSFLALGVLSFVYMLFAFWDVIKNRQGFGLLMPWVIYGLIALLLAAPQLIFFTFKQASGKGFLDFHLNWVNQDDGYFWFYIKNLGISYLLAIPALLYANKEMQRLYAGGIFLFFLAEIFVFQPNEYDNNKLIFIWYLLNCGLFSNFAVDLYKKICNFPGITYIAVLILIVCNISGTLTLCREFVSKILLFTPEAVAASEFIKSNTEKDALFLTTDNHNNEVAALAGRNILCGSPSYLYFHGVDYKSLQALQKNLFAQPTLEELRENSIDYVYIGEYERHRMEVIDEDFFAQNLILIYQNSKIDIYKVSDFSGNS